MSRTASRYDFRPVREQDDQGCLISAGFYWRETNYDAMLPAIAIATFSGVIALLLVLLSNGMSRQIDALPQVVMALIAIGGTSVLISLPFFRPLRGTVLHRDGGIALPHGLPGKAGSRRMLASHDEVVSIEARSRQSLGFAVVMILRDGSTTILSGNVTESEALMVAVQLTTALGEMRRSLAEGLRLVEPEEREDGRELVAPPRQH